MIYVLIYWALWFVGFYLSFRLGHKFTGQPWTWSDRWTCLWLGAISCILVPAIGVCLFLDWSEKRTKAWWNRKKDQPVSW